MKKGILGILGVSLVAVVAILINCQQKYLHRE